MAGKDYISFLIKYKHESRFTSWSELRVCDYHSIRDNSATLRKANERIILRPFITIIFDYPLTKEFHMTFCRPTGFTRKDIVACIYKGYRKIYSNTRFYRVWGHSIADLFIEAVVRKSTGVYELEIGS